MLTLFVVFGSLLYYIYLQIKDNNPHEEIRKILINGPIAWIVLMKHNTFTHYDEYIRYWSRFTKNEMDYYVKRYWEHHGLNTEIYIK